MNWKKLKSNKCPECGSNLDPAERDGLIFCGKSLCGFKIYIDRLSEIVSGMVTKDIDREYR